MEDKNIALLGFVSSAADYLKKQIKDNSEEIKELDEIDLDKIKSELGNRLGSSFGGVQDKSNDLINAGREAFNDFINDSSKMIDEFNDIFNVDFKKENDEKDEEMVNHLISILREPSKFEETNDFETQIARAANDSYIEDNRKIEVPGSDNEELDSLFSEIIANENIKVEEPVLNPFVDVETEFEALTKEPSVEENEEPSDDSIEEIIEEDEIEKDNSLKADEIKQLIRDTISEFFTNTNKPEEKEVKLDEVINSFDVLKNVGVDEEGDEIKEDDNKDEEFAEFESLCSGLDEVKYEELNPNNDSLLDGVFKRVDEYEEINEEELAELEEEPDVDLEDLLRPIDVLIEEEPVEEKIDDATEGLENILSPTNMSKDEEVVGEDVKDDNDSIVVEETTNDVDNDADRLDDILPSTDNAEDIVVEPRIEEATNDIDNDVDTIVERLENILPPVDVVIEEEWEKESKPFVVEERKEEPTIDIDNDIDSIVERIEKILPPITEVIDEEWNKVSAPIVVEERVEEPTNDIGNGLDDIVERFKKILPPIETVIDEKWEKESKSFVVEERKEEPTIDIGNDIESIVGRLKDIIPPTEPIAEEPKFSEDMLGVLDALSMDEGILEAEKDENLDEGFTCDDEIPLFDDVPLSEQLSNYADHADEEKEDDYLSDDADVDEQGSISSFLSELKDDDQISLLEDNVPGMRSLSELIESCNTLCPSEDEDDAPEVVENDYLEEYNNRSLEELYIPNPGLDILEQEEFDLGLDKNDENSNEDEADFDLDSKDETDYVGELFDEFTNNEYEVDDFKNKQERINELNKKIYDSIVALYPYLSNGFIKGVYKLKESFASDYKEGQKIIILHRLVFADLEGLRQFVDVMMSHEYFVNVDEKQMIVDTFKEHVNSDGKILTDIFEIANQAKLLTGEYDGYRIIEVDE